MATFWNDPQLDPKRAFRWRATFVGSDAQHISPFHVTRFSKPSVNVEVKEFITIVDGSSDIREREPRGLTWNPVTITIIDTGSPDVTSILYKTLLSSGYSTKYDTKKSIKSASLTKAGFGKSLGKVIYVDELNAEGQSISKWALHEPLIDTIDFGTLDYASEEFVEITLQIQYDVATYKATPRKK